jgi:hypothetical protein
MYMKEMLGIYLYSFPYINQQKLFVLLLIVYVLTSPNLEIRAEQSLPGSEGVGGEREGVGEKGGNEG